MVFTRQGNLTKSVLARKNLQFRSREGVDRQHSMLAALGLFLAAICIFSSCGNEASQDQRAQGFSRREKAYHVTADRLNMRLQPSTDSEIVAKLEKWMTVYEDPGATARGPAGWCHVRCPAVNAHGWVSRKYLSLGKGPPLIVQPGWTWTEDYGYCYIRGRVKNVGGDVITYFVVKVEFLDSRKNVVDSDWTNCLERIRPGAAKSFEIMHPAAPDFHYARVFIEEVQTE